MYIKRLRPEQIERLVDFRKSREYTKALQVIVHREFLKQIYSHKFVFAPRGNGIDTHRLWESLYLRTIPIVKKSIAMEDFYDLPILFVDDWDNITEDFLNQKYDEIINEKYPLEKLKIDYWFKLIENYI